MKNKTIKRNTILLLIISLITIVTISLISYINIKKYDYNNSLIISSIINNVKEEYPNLDDKKIIELLNSHNLNEDLTLKEYGIYIDKESISLANKKVIKETIITNIIILIIYSVIIIFIMYYFHKNKENNIKEITNYLKEINNQNYNLDIDSNSEDELSLLKNELYKTAIMLNEKSLNSKKEKDSLKESLSDISHQLKTPLTSINLMIDNLNNQNMSEKQRKELLINIRRKINSINFLVESLLKLSKFDANTITFSKSRIEIEKILYEVKENLSAICDLKDITINIKGKKKETLLCDYKWQVEALTNIVKNCIEHSNNSSSIDISYETNELLTKIIIKDYGVGITKEDQKHIFKRFYKGPNSSPDSVGIGLALAKTIIEKDNGNIYVESKLNTGTTFTIKYLKNNSEDN